MGSLKICKEFVQLLHSASLFGNCTVSRKICIPTSLTVDIKIASFRRSFLLDSKKQIGKKLMKTCKSASKNW